MYATKQLDEAEHNIMNYQNRGLCYLPKPKAEAVNRDIKYCVRAHEAGFGNILNYFLDMVYA